MKSKLPYNDYIVVPKPNFRSILILRSLPQIVPGRGHSADTGMGIVFLLFSENVEVLVRFSQHRKHFLVTFITISYKYTICNQIVKELEPTLRRKENLVQYKDWYVYIKRVACKIGHKEHTAYVYLDCDVDCGSDESRKALKRAAQNQTSTADLHKPLENSGLFMIVSSLPFAERLDFIIRLLSGPAPDP